MNCATEQIARGYWSLSGGKVTSTPQIFSVGQSKLSVAALQFLSVATAAPTERFHKPHEASNSSNNSSRGNNSGSSNYSSSNNSSGNNSSNSNSENSSNSNNRNGNNSNNSKQ